MIRRSFKLKLTFRSFVPTRNIRDNQLIIEGHHQERSDQAGTIERHFVRKYALPQDVELTAVESRLSDSGLLTVFAAKTHASAGRTVPIQTGSSRNSRRANNLHS
ncbi:Small heat shock protein OV25-1 [Toxocara canis]|uniref:Small heat shock protein OV25-1 n=1 Tax=Toxocara canis TaxID=6265 RepID=A0A0B2V0M9_TOXCA|nr:Small heat shock protein OV25-1 [Toxocara canis]